MSQMQRSLMNFVTPLRRVSGINGGCFYLDMLGQTRDFLLFLAFHCFYIYIYIRFCIIFFHFMSYIDTYSADFCIPFGVNSVKSPICMKCMLIMLTSLIHFGLNCLLILFRLTYIFGVFVVNEKHFEQLERLIEDWLTISRKMARAQPN